MIVPRHWVRETVKAVDAQGRPQVAEAWGWSADSVEEARSRAREAAGRVAQWLVDNCEGDPPPRSSQYAYCLDRPPREEIVQELHDAGGQTTAMITRNSYGSLVLNARDLLFVDVDFPRPSLTLGGLVKRLFGRSKPADEREQAVVERVEAWCAKRASLGLRLYRTAAGLRVAAVGRPMSARDGEVRQIFAELDSDPMYRRLCDVQECFRARLTPKPWRMEGFGPPIDPPGRYPFVDGAAEERYRQWQRRYEEAAPRFATCRLTGQYGSGAVHGDLAPLLKLHDSLSGALSDLPLA